MIVYIVTSGCYSDFGIDAVLETREQAEAYCALHPREDQSIDEWNTDEFSVETDKPVLKKWVGYIEDDGKIDVIFDGYTFNIVFEEEVVQNRYFMQPYKQIRFTTAKDKDDEQAKRILLDKMAALKYEQEMGLEFK